MVIYPVDSAIQRLKKRGRNIMEIAANFSWTNFIFMRLFKASYSGDANVFEAKVFLLKNALYWKVIEFFVFHLASVTFNLNLKIIESVIHSYIFKLHPVSASKLATEMASISAPVTTICFVFCSPKLTTMLSFKLVSVTKYFNLFFKLCCLFNVY